MQVEFFGDPQKQLLGLYHPARPSSDRGHAVVLCYPAAQEVMRTHWAFRKLAALLSKSGFHVFRFDYFGTGDSAGEIDQGTALQWRADIRTAVNEVRDLSGVEKVSLVGMRLGAALAATACAEGLEVDTLVLWEPAVSGRRHVAELASIENRKFSHFLYYTGPQIDRPEPELIALPFPAAMRGSIESMNLVTCTTLAAKRVCVMVSEEREEYSHLHAHMKSLVPSHYEHVADDAGGDSAVMLSNAILDRIESVLAGEEA